MNANRRELPHSRIHIASSNLSGFVANERELMPRDIIDSRNSYLAEAVQPLLNESVRTHFAVGYFFLSGFKAIAKQLESWRRNP